MAEMAEETHSLKQEVQDQRATIKRLQAQLDRMRFLVSPAASHPYAYTYIWCVDKCSSIISTHIDLASPKANDAESHQPPNTMDVLA